MAAKKSSNNLIWLDLEMTGLDHTKDVILEIATIATDKDLNILAEGPSVAIFHHEDKLKYMDAWCTSTHTASGLVKRVKESQITTKEAERLTLEFIKQWVPSKESPLCGNSIGTDRRFLTQYMPALENFFHYRVIDVSSIKELAKRWRPDIEYLQKSNNHIAMQDVKDSIDELKYYREYFIRQ